MQNSKEFGLSWRAEPLPHLYGSYVKVYMKTTNKMVMTFVMDYEIKGHPERLIPYIEDLMEKLHKLQYWR